MKRSVLTLLAALGVAAGLAVTASSTSAQAYEAGMRGLALAALVVVLEVVNTLGTLVWLTDTRPHATWQAGALVGCASLVTGWCGLLTYGPIGLVGPFFVLAGVHLANLAATTPRPPRPGATEGDAQDEDKHEGEEGEPPTEVAPAPPTPPAQGADAPPPPQETPNGPAPAHAQGESAPQVVPPIPPSADDEEIVAALLALPELPGRDAVKAAHRVGTRRAERLLDLARERRRPHLVKEAR